MHLIYLTSSQLIFIPGLWFSCHMQLAKIVCGLMEGIRSWKEA